ncbi:hypothetical protein M378DRAFT_172829 [Amanita muscaria Koide BX008]|uniref:Uncharacterized protein n=1 Tax=Amanita muscaria (strain Koide BX008) TaxID=946122 RepID=A0A0C2W584_AMAMK|nr:hypothetical protein M378DRAFT_172829 [Amanita muscaria Koide BX008]
MSLNPVGANCPRQEKHNSRTHRLSPANDAIRESGFLRFAMGMSVSSSTSFKV